MSVSGDSSRCKIPGPQGYSPSSIFSGSQYADEYRRICKIVGSHPDGLTFGGIAQELHGQKIDIDGGDPRYQRIRRFTANHPDLFDTADDASVQVVRPTLDLISLILSGIVQNPGSDDEYQPGKDWAENMLKTVRPQWDEDTESINWNLTEKQKWHLQQCFADYVERIDDLRIVLESVDSQTKPEYLSLPYRTRFNDEGRVKKQFSVLNKSLEAAAKEHETACFVTLTTEPKHFDNLYESIAEINTNWNRFMSWLSTDSRLGYRPEFLKILEFQESGNPHLHAIIFLDQPDDGSMPWLVDKSDLDDYWSKWQGGYVNDIQPLVYQTDLGSEYEPDAGWVKWDSDGDHGGLLDESTSNDGEGCQTAGQYIGKYLSKTFGLVQSVAADGAAEAFREGATSDDVDPWKLALYWATGKKVKTQSRGLRQMVEADHDDDDPDGELAEILTTDYRVIGAFSFDNIPLHIRHNLTIMENATDESEDDEEFGIFEDVPDPPDDAIPGGYKID